jgi:hypothetical protein
MEQIKIEVIIEELGLEWDEDSKQRNVLLAQFPYSVQVATSFVEMDFAEKWLVENCGAKGVNWEDHFYCKTAYDFGYGEYFFQDEMGSGSFEKEIPRIYGVFANGTKLRTNVQGEYFDLE